MHLKITGRHLKVDPEMKEYTRKKLARLEEHVDRILDASVIITDEKKRILVELSIDIGGTHLHSSQAARQPHAAVDAAIEKIEKQMRKVKDRRRDLAKKHRRNQRTVSFTMNVFSDKPLSDGDLNIVRREHYERQSMTVDDAVHQLEVTGAKFLVFVNEKTMKLNVLYKQSDVGYALIEPRKEDDRMVNA